MIELAFFDFDGVFTDGTVMFIGSEIVKSYNIKDGMGIKTLLKNNIQVFIISGYQENISQQSILDRLGVYSYFGVVNKLELIEGICKDLGFELDSVSYMGDDINDIDVLKKVGLSGCPADAHESCKEWCSFVSSKNGGRGCVRDMCDRIINSNKEISVIDQIRSEAIYQLNNINIDEIFNLSTEIIKCDGNIYFIGVGKSGNMAKHCSDLLKSVSVPTHYIDPLNCLHGDIGVINEKDMVILFSSSGNTTELIDLIPFIKNKGCIIIGICCNGNSRFMELCNSTIVIPFKKEIDGEINKIPTNSAMSHLFFSNILVSLLKDNIELDKYKMNHPAGNIGKSLKKIKDVMMTKFPKMIAKNGMALHDILFEMTNYSMGCCVFVDDDNKFIGILTDGDIRRLLLNNDNKENVYIGNINSNCYCEHNIDKLVIDCNKKSYIPVIDDNNNVIGMIDTTKMS